MANTQLPNIAVFASGYGSNFQTIIDTVNVGKIDANITLLITDKPDCYAVERAINNHIPIFAFDPKDYTSKEEYERDIVAVLQECNVQLIVLAGYMRLIGSTLLEAFPDKIINIHPALLPAFPGKNGIEQAYNYGVKIFGITIHYVDAGIDTGKIIDQLSFKATGEESLEEIETKIHQMEHQLYPEVIQKLIKKII